MAKTEYDEEFEESGSGFSRFLFFVTPILFTVVLLGVLLTLFNINVRNTLMDLGNKIPIVKNFVPDPEGTDKEKSKEQVKKQEKEKSTEATVKQLKEQVAKQETDLQEANRQVTEHEGKVKELQEQLDSAEQKKAQQEQAAEQEAYQKEVKKLAQLYAQMSPSKAAAILGNLTTEETLQMLSVMSNDSKAAILEKMDPQKAADISIKLKDVNSSEDLAISALQSRLKKESADEASTPKTNAGLDDAQLSQTFSSMSADAASTLVLQTYKISADKALKILKAVDDSTRSNILAKMAEQDEKLSVKILNQLISK
ncbi:MgtE intracellular N domain protein [compost metagenome]